MTGSALPCPSCGRPLRGASRFCGGCGAAVGAEAPDRVDVLRREDLVARRRVQAIVTVYGGVFLVLILGSLGWREGLLSDAGFEIFHPLGFAAMGAVAVQAWHVVGWRESLPLATTRTGLAMGVLGGLVMIGIGSAYVGLLDALVGGGEAGGDDPEPLLLALLTVAVVPALVEEWLCRGVLWKALEGAASPRLTILLTAVLFAFLHGLGGGFLLELPHRFLAGLVLGWLRLKYGSLTPGIAAHFLNNAIAVLIG